MQPAKSCKSKEPSLHQYLSKGAPKMAGPMRKASAALAALALLLLALLIARAAPAPAESCDARGAWVGEFFPGIGPIRESREDDGRLGGTWTFTPHCLVAI